jgi:crotonobetainyl-CoA:carnitine CoA-transferase CaiB-like acyl-CoA transferase
MRRPLEGIRVIDLTIWQHGPYATALLADLGADVVKIEERASGDPGRYLAVAGDLELSSYFEAHNRGKRSVALDLKRPAGRDVLLRLAAGADIFVTNYRIGAIQRLGLDYGAVSAANPRIVYVQASGFGPAGDEADAGAFDFIVQARSGFASTNGEPDDPPLPTPIPIADQVGAMHACVAALAGLASAKATGKGMRLDTSLLGSMVSLQSFNIDSYLFTGVQRERPFRGGPRPFWRVYQGGDGAWFVIGMLLDRAWPELAHIIGRPDLAEDQRFTGFASRVGEYGPELIAILDEAFLGAPAREWVERLNGVGMFASLVQSHAQVAADPQVRANGYIQDVPRADGPPVPLAASGISVDGEPLAIRGLAPRHGEHTEAVLLEAGYTWDEIVTLRDGDVIGPAGA